MSDSTNGEAASMLQSILTVITNEGFANIGAMVAKLHDTAAELDRAEKARDKFALANDEASKIIGSKGTEKGELLKQLEESKAETAALQVKLDTTTTIDPTKTPPQGTPKPTDKPPTKPVAEQLAELEADLTEEQWELAGTLLSMVEDKDEAVALNEDPAKRLAFLSDLASHKDVKEKPTAFTRKSATNEPQPKKDESLVDQLMKQAFGVTHGPSGRAVAMGGRSRSTQPRPDSRLS